MYKFSLCLVDKGHVLEGLVLFRQPRVAGYVGVQLCKKLKVDVFDIFHVLSPLMCVISQETFVALPRVTEGDAPPLHYLPRYLCAVCFCELRHVALDHSCAL